MDFGNIFFTRACFGRADVRKSILPKRTLGSRQTTKYSSRTKFPIYDGWMAGCEWLWMATSYGWL